MFHNLQFYSTPDEIEGFFDAFFGGIFMVPGIPIVLEMGWVVAVLLAIACLYFEHTQKNFPKTLAPIFSYLGFLLCLPSMVQPWDEVFINLRHSLHFAEHNHFSFNVRENIEGTVDFLPYFLIGCLGKLGFSISELGWWQCVLGGLLCIAGGVKILVAVSDDKSKRGLFTFILCLFPPLILNSATGFATTLFTSAIIWAVYFLFFSSRFYWGAFCLALIPLIRTEGLLFSLLVAFVFAKRDTKKIPVLLIAFIPSVLLTLWRVETFGHPIPIPIRYKATLGRAFYSLLGVRGFFADLIAGGALWSLFVIGLGYGVLKRSLSLLPLLLLFIFTLPYYLGGGDWFPSQWARYFLPFSFLSFLYAVWICLAFTQRKKWTPVLLTTVIVSWLVSFVPPFHSYFRASSLLTLARPTLAMLSIKYENRTQYRIQHLSQVGVHFGRILEPNDIIGSSEIATIQYFAKRDAVDFLGVANAEVAAAPIRPTPPIFRKREKEAHLPYTIFRKLKPQILSDRMPEVLYTFDFIPGILIKEVPEKEWGEKEVKLAFARWLERYRVLVDSLYGGYANLEKLGYTPIVVRYGTDFMTCYFVSPAARAKHLAKMEALGLTGKKLNI